MATAVPRKAIDWEQWRDTYCGAMIVVGLCWPYIFQNLTPSIPWWGFFPFAMVGGFLRQRTEPRPLMRYVPLAAFILVVLAFIGLGHTIFPISPYGMKKGLIFLALAFAAVISATRQTPLTERFTLGMRWALAFTFVLALLVAWSNRDIFLNVYNMESSGNPLVGMGLTSFPLVFSMTACFAIPSTLSPSRLFLGAGVLLLAALIAVMVRGRFNALMLVSFAMLLVLGPPWKHLFWRILVCGLVGILFAGVVINVLPLMGDSYNYLTAINAESLGGRTPLLHYAWEGFMREPFGHGLGSFAVIDPIKMYPHNVIVESAYETGIFGLLAILAIYAMVLWRTWQLWLSPPHRILAGLLLVVFLNMLKAGDISSIAFHWVFLYLIIVCTPLSKSWPLRRGAEVE